MVVSPAAMALESTPVEWSSFPILAVAFHLVVVEGGLQAQVVLSAAAVAAASAVAAAVADAGVLAASAGCGAHPGEHYPAHRQS